MPLASRKRAGSPQVSVSGTAAAVGDVLAQASVYDANGNLIRTNYALDVTQGDTNNGVEETRSYDANERELTDNQYFELGQTRSYTDPKKGVRDNFEPCGALFAAGFSRKGFPDRTVVVACTTTYAEIVPDTIYTISRP